MTPEQRAKAYADSKKVVDWVNTSPLAEAWLEGHKAKVESYIADATIAGMQEQIDIFIAVINVLLEKNRKNERL